MESIKKSERSHETWLENYKAQTLRQYLIAWNYFTEFLKPKNEKWLLENKTSEDWAQHLTNFHRFLKKQPLKRGDGVLSDNSAKMYTNAIRGFLGHVGIGVGLQPVQKEEITKVTSMPMLDFPFDLKSKVQVLSVSSPTEEYIISVGISLGLRIGDFLRITRGVLEPLLDREIPIQMGKIITVKEGFPAYPFIDGDAKFAIKRLLAEMDREKRTSPKERMLNLSPRKVNAILKELFVRADLPLGDYRIRFHCLRKFISDCLASVSSGDKWKWFVGKSASSPYVQAEGKEAYTRVLRLTQVNGSSKAKTSSKVEMSNLKNRISELEKLLVEGPSTQFLLENTRNRIRYIDSMIEVAKTSREIEPQVAKKYDELIRELEEWKAESEATLERFRKLGSKVSKEGEEKE